MSTCMLLVISYFISKINGQDVPNDIGCNYVNFGGVAISTDFCFKIDEQFGVKVACNADYSGVDLEVWDNTRCIGGAVQITDYTQNVTDFYCDASYDGRECPDVSLKTYGYDNCTGEYDEIRFVTDECLYSEPNKYAIITCNESSAEYSEYDSSDCNVNSLINKTQIHEGKLDGIDAGCIAVDGCSDDTTSTTANPVSTVVTVTETPRSTRFIPTVPNIPAQDIGCNYMNFGGMGIPLGLCYQVPYNDYSYSVRIDCNDTENGVDAEIWLGDHCKDRDGLYKYDLTEYIPAFWCDKSYQNNKCNTVQLTLFTEDTCSGDNVAISLIKDECLAVTDEYYAGLTCDADSATYSLYTSDDCNPDSLNETVTINEQSYSVDGYEIGCIKVGGCGDIETTQKPRTTSSGGSNGSSNNSNSMVTGILIGSGAVVVFGVIVGVIIFITKKKSSTQIAHVKLDGGNNDMPQINIDDEFLPSRNIVGDSGGIKSVSNSLNEPYRQLDTEPEQ